MSKHCGILPSPSESSCYGCQELCPRLLCCMPRFVCNGRGIPPSETGRAKFCSGSSVIGLYSLTRSVSHFVARCGKSAHTPRGSLCGPCTATSRQERPSTHSRVPRPLARSSTVPGVAIGVISGLGAHDTHPRSWDSLKSVSIDETWCVSTPDVILLTVPTNRQASEIVADLA